ncbi:SAM-dependent methyltransferase [Streptomyces sp. TRM66268-LWL]|uniref:SAM-dependent methyltransferase n=1 Tax=Streptomyces polyasparticus TaxID=2767826 RepID=A0ABR7STF5_9ACTN|nr:SAM-dependent methyltransferase [Streptomyces polyasparticus]MBC9717628.1 SAM-dependent methyltransferase [Streptomyces polyasparticus]
MDTPTHSERPFDELVREAEEADVSGWDFGWYAGRATEQRPSWGYQRLLAERLGQATAALDLQTGGGEVLAGALRLAERRPALSAATEGYPPNVLKATELLHPLGTAVVAAPDEPPFPFADGGFDLVTSRHPVRPYFGEIARVLAPGGMYFAQHVGPASVFELVEYFLGPLPEEVRRGRHPDDERAEAEAAGLAVADLRLERLRMEFFDIGAVVHFLRKVVWMVPGFTVEKYLPQLRALDEQIRAEGPFVAHSTRFLIEARKR